MSCPDAPLLFPLPHSQPAAVASTGTGPLLLQDHVEHRSTHSFLLILFLVIVIVVITLVLTVVVGMLVCPLVVLLLLLLIDSLPGLRPLRQCLQTLLWHDHG
jgi:hypothetical protein